MRSERFNLAGASNTTANAGYPVMEEHSDD